MRSEALRTAVTGLWAKRRARTLELEARTTSSRLAWDAPATTISLAGVHGGAGTTTLCLLLAEAIATVGEGPALAVDLAGRSRGGLAVLGGAAGQTTAEGTCAVAAIHGGRLERPFGVNERGVRIIGAHPDGVEELDRSHETLVARLVEAVGDGGDDARLAELARFAVREDRSWRALRWDNEQVVEAVGRVLDQAAVHHALVAVDLGMLDGELLADTVGTRSHLHVWVVPGRAASLEIAERRLPLVPFEPAGDEAIAVWQADGSAPSAKRLSGLGDVRGCPVVRVANQGDPGDDLATRMHRCLSGITELCELAR
jgi:hypothetical protein